METKKDCILKSIESFSKDFERAYLLHEKLKSLLHRGREFIYLYEVEENEKEKISAFEKAESDFDYIINNKCEDSYLLKMEAIMDKGELYVVANKIQSAILIYLSAIKFGKSLKGESHKFDFCKSQIEKCYEILLYITFMREEPSKENQRMQHKIWMNELDL